MFNFFPIIAGFIKQHQDFCRTARVLGCRTARLAGILRLADDELLEARDVVHGMLHLTKCIATQALQPVSQQIAGPFGVMRLSAQGLSEKPADEQLELVLTRLDHIIAQPSRTALLVVLFGREVPVMLSMHMIHHNKWKRVMKKSRRHPLFIPARWTA